MTQLLYIRTMMNTYYLTILFIVKDVYAGIEGTPVCGPKSMVECVQKTPGKL